jgi:2-polyprenyl-6-methoxyphenol hydroxylase-like FAD-dependent oxidoreductase
MVTGHNYYQSRALLPMLEFLFVRRRAHFRCQQQRRVVAEHCHNNWWCVGGGGNSSNSSSRRRSNGSQLVSTVQSSSPTHRTTTRRQFLCFSSVVGHEPSKQQQQPPPPIVIVGGGPVGLLLSILFSEYGVAHVLLERQSVQQRFQHPQAHFLNTRTMELLRNIHTHDDHTANTSSSSSDPGTSSCTTIPLGTTTLYESIRQQMSPVQHWRSFRYGTSIYDCGHNPLAEIIHPVHQPLQSNADSNGTFVGTVGVGGGRNGIHHIPDDTTSKDTTITSTTTTMSNGRHDLSPCTVGHLPQHTLGRILYDTARQQPCSIAVGGHPGSHILYHTTVERMEFMEHSRTTGDPNDGHHNTIQQQQQQQSMVRIVAYNEQQQQRQEYYTDLVIAADGAHSTIRQQLWDDDHTKVTRRHHDDQQQQLQEEEEKKIEQHLVNIHVQIPIHIAHQIHANHNYAMLYSVYTSEVIAMVVCHSIGEYVVQIPYFPPYQTIMDDFNVSKVSSLLDSIFGFPNISQHYQIRSIAPWTMRSWIADHYYQYNPSSSSKDTVMTGVVLVGDAAHVFPPAGGFGMNTGLQDVHNLAWKIAAHRQCYPQPPLKQPHPFVDSNDTSPIPEPTTAGDWSLQNVLHSYETERRPIARQNAALSVRNYQRLLDVTKTLYLDAQHPALLCSILDHSPLPLSVRQHLFRSLLKTALYPLSWLRTPNGHRGDNINDVDHVGSNSDRGTNWLSYATHVRNNLQQILHTGAGLPLLFPRFEIGFIYRPRTTTTSTIAVSSETRTTSDTLPDVPALVVGRLVPHTRVQVMTGLVSNFPRLKYLHPSTTSAGTPASLIISTIDLPAQMTNPNDIRPLFVLLWAVKRATKIHDIVVASDLCRRMISERLGLPVALAILFPGTIDIELEYDSSISFLGLSESALPQAFSFFSTTSENQLPYAVLIRPDGHASGVATTDRINEDDDATSRRITPSIIQRLLLGVLDIL